MKGQIRKVRYNRQTHYLRKPQALQQKYLLLSTEPVNGEQSPAPILWTGLADLTKFPPVRRTEKVTYLRAADLTAHDACRAARRERSGAYKSARGFLLQGAVKKRSSNSSGTSRELV